MSRWSDVFIVACSMDILFSPVRQEQAKRNWLALSRRYCGGTKYHQMVKPIPWQLIRHACASVGFCRALEFKLKRRLYDPQLGEYALRGGFTLGTVPFAYANKDTKKDAKTNWN